MEKYKLIKEYPGSPILGCIIDLKKENWFNDCFLLNNKYYIYNITSSPEFWREIVEKEYEILSFRSKFNGNILFHKPEWDKEFFEDNRWEIYSVKRLSDGEIFTIGDRIKEKWGKTDCWITKINLINNNIQIEFTKYVDMPFYQPIILLKNIQKAKQKLFTTEDGVDIFEGDEFWTIYKNVYRIYSHKAKDLPLNYIHLANNCLTFSTKEKAEEYIILNKPCLSYSNIIRLWSLSPESFEKLSELVKSKLNIK